MYLGLLPDLFSGHCLYASKFPFVYNLVRDVPVWNLSFGHATIVRTPTESGLANFSLPIFSLILVGQKCIAAIDS